MTRIGKCVLSVAFLVVCLLMGPVFSGCDRESRLKNACPRVVNVGSVEWIGEDLRIGVWLQDLEEDPVDLVVTLANGDEIEGITGHGVVGLTSAAELPGQPHELLLPGDQIESGEVVTLEPVDTDGCTGPAVTITVP
jgi:hypothetical protein